MLYTKLVTLSFFLGLGAFYFVKKLKNREPRIPQPKEATVRTDPFDDRPTTAEEAAQNTAGKRPPKAKRNGISRSRRPRSPRPKTRPRSK